MDVGVFWDYVPSNPCVDVLTFQKVTLFANRVFTEVTNLKWGHEALIQCDSYPYKKGSLETHTRRRVYEDEGREQSEASTPGEMPHIGSKRLVAQEKEQNNFLSQPSEGTSSVDPLI